MKTIKYTTESTTITDTDGHRAITIDPVCANDADKVNKKPKSKPKCKPKYNICTSPDVIAIRNRS